MESERVPNWDAVRNKILLGSAERAALSFSATRSDGLIPGNRRKFRITAISRSAHWPTSAGQDCKEIGESGVATRAQVAAADGIKRIAFDFFHASNWFAKLFSITLNSAFAAHHAHDGATARAARRTNGGMPLLLSGNDFVIRH